VSTALLSALLVVVVGTPLVLTVVLVVAYRRARVAVESAVHAVGTLGPAVERLQELADVAGRETERIGARWSGHRDASGAPGAAPVDWAGRTSERLPGAPAAEE
jgi:hypothetical protein